MSERKIKYTWKIPKFDASVERYWSPEFGLDNWEWQLGVTNKDESLGVFLYAISSAGESKKWSRPSVTYKIDIRKSNGLGALQVRATTRDKFGTGEGLSIAWGWSEFLSHSDIKDALDKDGALTIVAEVEQAQRTNLEILTTESEPRPAEYKAALYRNSSLADVEFVVVETEEEHAECALGPAAELADETAEEPHTETSELPADEATKEPRSDTSETPADQTAEEPHTETSELPADEATKEPRSDTSELPADEVTATNESSEHSFLAHRAILAAESEYFNKMFTSELSEGSSKGIAKVIVEDFEHYEIESMLEFIYTGKISHKFNSLDEPLRMIMLADRYQLKQLHNYIGMQIIQDFFDDDNCFVILDALYTYSSVSKLLSNVCMDYITTNLKTLMDTEQFNTFIRTTENRELLVDLLNRISDIIKQGK